MKSIFHSITPDLYFNCLFALGVVAVTTLPLVYDSHLLKNCDTQTASALERARFAEAEVRAYNVG